MQDLFVKIANREIPAEIIWENDDFMAFLDTSPIQTGHTLVIPKSRTDYIFDLNDYDFSEFFLAAKTVAQILKSKLKCKKVGILVEGFAVSHCHIHLIPLNYASDMNSEPQEVSSEELAKTAKRLTE